MSEENVLCPYCGAWNGNPDGVEMTACKIMYGGDGLKNAYDYQCRKCGARTPTANSKKDARAAAMRRFTPTTRTTRLLHKYSRPKVYADLWLHCEKCNGLVGNEYKRRYKYCPECGLKVVHQDE